jgi:YVTN family beta-propeller protein
MHHPVEERMLGGRFANVAVLTIALASVLAMAGCGNQYRPVVSAIGPVGPAGQPTKYAVAVSNPNSTSLGLVTIVDFAGDTTLSTPQILSNPNYFVLNPTGTQGYVINPQGGLNTFLLTNPTALISSDVVQTTLPVNSNPISITSLSPASALATIFVPVNDPLTGPNVYAINTGTAALYATVAVAANPVYVVGAAKTPRVYALSQGSNPGTSTGEADALETISTIAFSNSAQIPVGVEPVYGVMTNDDQRAFVMNRGSNTVSVINVPNNALDANISTINVGTHPVWADLNSVASELVVLNQGDGVHPGSLSIINVALCNAAAQATNPNCSATNPVDGVGFGQVLATVPVGIDPTPGYGMVSVLQGNDGNPPAAYVINELDGTGTCGAGEGSVTVVNLQTNQVANTICGVSGSAATAAANGASNVIFGHPNSISATGGQPSGKVYVTSSDNTYMSILYTDTNTVLTHVPLQGTGLRVLVTSP